MTFDFYNLLFFISLLTILNNSFKILYYILFLMFKQYCHRYLYIFFIFLIYYNLIYKRGGINLTGKIMSCGGNVQSSNL